MQQKTKFFIKYYSIYFIKNFFLVKILLILLLNKNLTATQTSVVLSIQGIVGLLIEIPNGVLTDYFGYKKSIILSILIFIFGYLVILNNRSFISFCIFYACFGVYETIFYTAKELLFYNSMKHLDLVDNFSKYKSTSRIASFSALALSSFFSGKITNNSINNVNLVLIVDIIMLVINILIILSMKEYKRENSKKLNKNYFNSLKNSFNYVKKHKTLLKLIFFEMFWYPLTNIVIVYCPLIYEEISPVVSKNFAVSLMVSVQIISIVSFQTLFIGKMSKKNLISQNALFIVGAICSLISFYSYKGLFSYLFNILYLLSTQTADLLTIPVIYDLIPEKSQACIISMISFFDSISKIVILYFLGIVSQIYNYRIGFMVVFWFYLLCCIIFFISISLDKHFRKIMCKKLAKNT